jgi:hypothetical protein
MCHAWPMMKRMSELCEASIHPQEERQFTLKDMTVKQVMALSNYAAHSPGKLA